jgi:hypothetical protein
VNRVPVALLWAASLSMLGLLLYSFSLRVGHPYNLEWMEGGMLVHGLRAMEGDSLYPPPSSDFIPFIYPPLYSWMLAGLGHLFGLGYAVGRSLSLAGTLAAALALVFAVRQEGGRLAVGAASAALFLSTYDESGTFMDLVRTDGICLALIGWSLVSVRGGRTILGGALLCLAFLSKHNAAIFGFPCLWWLWRYRGRGSALRFVAASAGPALLATGLMQWSTDGLFLTYLLGVPSKHPFVGSRFFWLTGKELAGALPIAIAGILVSTGRSGWMELPRRRAYVYGGIMLLAAGLFAAHGSVQPWLQKTLAGSGAFPRSKDLGSIFHGALLWGLVLSALWALRSCPRGEGTRFWLANGGLAILFSAIMRGHHGGFVNVLMPGLWALSLWAGLCLAKVWEPTGGRAEGALSTSGSTDLLIARLVCLLLLGTQLWTGKWDPGDFAPTDADVKAGDMVVEKIREVGGPVFAPHSPWYVVMAGQPYSAHLIAIWDIDHKGGPLHRDVSKIRTDIKSKRWKALLLANERFDYGRKGVYTQREKIRLPGAKSLMPKVGWKVRPSSLYLPE